MIATPTVMLLKIIMIMIIQTILIDIAVGQNLEFHMIEPIISFDFLL